MEVPKDNFASPKAVVFKQKLYAPSLRPEYIPRPRVLKLLTEGLKDHKITLVDAPPGYGKTTLLAQWRQAEGDNLPISWVSLDEQDNEPMRLWAHVWEALRQIAPEEALGTNVPQGPDSDGSGHWENVVQTKLPLLLNELTECSQRMAIVFDDYQCIKHNDCHKMMAFFIEQLPKSIHVIFSTRQGLPLPLGRWRARGEVNEIRAEQLAFSEHEVAFLFKGNLDLDLAPGDLRTLLARTEGWPAALYLASLSLRGKKDAHAFIESFSGSNRFIVEILAEEVLATLSEEERDFLLLSSVLEKLSASLCEAVTGMRNAGKLLRDLEHSNLFIVPLDDNGEWYRYHHLFAEFLRYELDSTRPQLVPALHERASEWLERAGLVDTAIDHAFTIEDFARARQLITRHWLGYALSGQRITLERWLSALPEDLVSGNAALALVRAWIFALQGKREECQRYLELAEDSSYEGRLPDGSPSVEAGAALIRGLFGYGGIRDMVAAARRAEKLESLEQTTPRTPLVNFALGMSLYYAGESSAAEQPLKEALQLTGIDQPVLRTTVLCIVSFVAADQGRLEEAESRAREARAVVVRYGLEWIPQSSAVPIALGLALAERGKVTEAEDELERGLSSRRRFPYLSPWPTLVGLLALAPVKATRGDRDDARALLAEARAIVEAFPDAGMFAGVLERRVRELSSRKRQTGAHSQELTERELAVLRLLDGERSNREIGRILYVSPNTVKAHIKSIYRKLGVSSREEAAEQGHARGLT